MFPKICIKEFVNYMSGGGGGTPVDPTPGICQEFYKSINLVDANEAALSKVKVGDRLDFSVFSTGVNKSLRVVNGDEIVGAVIKHAPQIIRCIEEGITYKAVITSLEGAACVLEAVKTS